MVMVTGGAWCSITLFLLSPTAVTVGNDSAQLRSLLLASVAGSRGLCKPLEVATWLGQAES